MMEYRYANQLIESWMKVEVHLWFSSFDITGISVGLKFWKLKYVEACP